MHIASSVAFAAAATVISASPVVKPATIPVSVHNNVESMKGLVHRGQARLRHFNGVENDGTSELVSSGPVTNDDVTYTANVTIGGASWQLIVDTGSSNVWCGVHKPCEKTSTGKDTGHKFTISYGSGQVSGEEYTDVVSFAGMSVKSQSLGAATKSQGFGAGIDGILGLGPVDLTQKTVANTSTVPTFMDNLYEQGSISSEILGVSFRPITGSSTSSTNGELTLGGTDSTKYSGSISYTPTLKEGLASKYWGVQLTGSSFGSTKLATKAHNLSGIVDTGTTLIYLPAPVYRGLVKASNAKIDSNTGLLSWTEAPTQSVTLELGSVTLTLTPAQYLVPQAQYTEFGLTSGKYYGWFAEGSDSGVQAIFGQKLLENYYAVFDTTNSRIGFATGV